MSSTIITKFNQVELSYLLNNIVVGNRCPRMLKAWRRAKSISKSIVKVKQQVAMVVREMMTLGSFYKKSTDNHVTG